MVFSHYIIGSSGEAHQSLHKQILYFQAYHTDKNLLFAKQGLLNKQLKMDEVQKGNKSVDRYMNILQNAFSQQVRKNFGARLEYRVNFHTLLPSLSKVIENAKSLPFKEVFYIIPSKQLARFKLLKLHLIQFLFNLLKHKLNPKLNMTDRKSVV